MKKFLILMGSILGLIILLIITLLCLISFRFSEKSIQKMFIRDEVVLSEISTYLQGQPYNYMSFRADKGVNEVYVSNANEMGESITVTDSYLIKRLKILFKKRHYDSITKDKNYICFNRYSSLRFGQGIIVSTDERMPDRDYLLKIKPLKEKWYYYEEK